MKELWKTEWKNILTAVAYVVVALVVYIWLLCSLLPANLWWVTLIVGIAILAAGILCSILYVKSCVREDERKKAEAQKA